MESNAIIAQTCKVSDIPLGLVQRIRTDIHRKIQVLTDPTIQNGRRYVPLERNGKINGFGYDLAGNTKFHPVFFQRRINAAQHFI